MKLVRLAAALSIAASATHPATAQTPDSASVAAGTRYRAGSLHRMLLGSHYRDLWTTPVRVDLLNLRTFAGGLTPTTAGGRLQSRSLRFRAADGRQYAFRLVDKNPVGVLPEELRETFAADVLQDQTSAGHPAAPLVVGPLLDAVGVLHPDLRFMVLRDEPALGQFRDEFVGKLGTFEQRILSPPAGQRGIGGATRVVNSDTLFALLARDPRERVDAHRLLTARLVDLYVGDPDRHRDQWTWAKSGPAPADPWLPIPEDRDQALIRYDGFFLMLTRSRYPEVLNLGDRYGNMIGMTRAGSELDRKLLSGLAWPTWDSIATKVQATLTDAIIEAAVAHMPREYLPLDSARLASTLKRRRDQLPALARRFYALIAHDADVHTTDLSERIVVERRQDGALDLRVFEPEMTAPYLQRRYSPAETKNLQIYLHGGDDRVSVTGQGPRSITLRVIGGDGDDVLIDSVGGTRFYDQTGNNQASGRTTTVNRRPYAEPVDPPGPLTSPRDFGRDWFGLPWFLYSPDYGVFAGFGAARIGYAFRKLPYASRVTFRAGYATGASALKTEFTGDFRHENSRAHTTLLAKASQLEVIRFYGLGNDAAAPGPTSLYRVNQEQLVLHAAMAFPLGPKFDAGLGPVMRYARTKLQPGRFITLIRPYGAQGFGTSEGFGQIGGRAWLNFDTRNRPVAATRGVLFAAEGSVYPKFWDVASTFGEAHAEAATYLTAKVPFRPTLALRAGGKKVFGTYPFHEAAFLGGAGSVRGLPLQRFAGDAAIYGNAELRLFLTKFFVILPGDFGIFALGDVGRVYLRGETSNTWHSGVGGGIWIAFLGGGNTLSVAVAKSGTQTGVYVGTGFGF